MDLYPPHCTAALDANDTLYHGQRMINSVKLIDHLFILTKGPVGCPKLILYYIWEMAFAFYAPHAAALTILVLAVLAIVAAIQPLYLDRRTHYQ